MRLEHLLQGSAAGGGGLGVALPAAPEVGDLAGPGLAFDDTEIVARRRRSGEAQDLNRHRGAGFVDDLALVAGQGAHAPPFAAGDEDVADLQRTPLHQGGGHGAAALLHLRLDDHALGAALGIGLEIEELRLQEDDFLQLLQVGPFLGRNLDRQDIASHLLERHVVLQQIGAHPPGVGIGAIDLVDGDDDRDLRRLGMVDGLHGLRHDAVVGGDDEDDDVGHLGAARPHLREGGVAGGIDEGDLAARGARYLIGADVLGDAARLLGGDVGLAQGI